MGIQIEDYTPPVKENAYTADVKALAEAGEGKLGKIVVKAGGKVPAAKLAFQNAAKALGYSARCKLEDVSDKGDTTLGFVLFEKRKPADSGTVESAAPDVTTKD